MIIRFMFDEIEFRKQIEDILIVSAFEPNDSKTRKWLTDNAKLILDKYILQEYKVVCSEANNIENSMEIAMDIVVHLPSGTWLSFGFKISPVDFLPK